MSLLSVKRCYSCGIEKLLTEFHKAANTASGRCGSCKTCRNAAYKRYSQANRKQHPELELTAKDAVRFWSKVDRKNDLDECWNWLAGCFSFGHGQFRIGGIGGTNAHAHRISYILTYGSIPDNLHVLHKCDNPKCVNPNHLFLGTNQDNVADMVRKGRQARQKGELCCTAKLKEADVLAIRRLYKSGVSQRAIAKEYGVGQQLVSLIVSKKRWSHI